jgi:uncharacterized protein YndB with AHSA1/START domain
MEQKTNVTAEDGKQVIVITREFDLPLELLFRAYTDPEILEQWMGTKVLKLENKDHGSWKFQTADAQGKVLFQATGVIHAFIPNQKITRTFEMENAPFGVQLEFLEFEKLTDDTSRLTMQTVYRSVTERDKILQLGLSQGVNMAHNRLQAIAGKLK